jgi:TonB family protein
MNLRLRTAAAIALFSTCAAAPPQTKSRPAHAPENGLAGLITTDDYPLAALRNDEQGEVAVRLDIDSSGSVSGCTVVESSRSASLDAATCALLRERAHFTPARDARGRPAPDVYRTRVGWRIAPKGPADAILGAAVVPYLQCLARATRPMADGPAAAEAIVEQAYSACVDAEGQARNAMAAVAPPAGVSPWPPDLRRALRQMLVDNIRLLREGPRVHARSVTGTGLSGLVSADDYPPAAMRAGEQGSVRVRLEVDEKGRPSGCKVIAPSGSESLDTATCRLLQERAQFVPARDRLGRPVPDTVSQTIAWRITDPERDPAVRAALQRWSACLYQFTERHLADAATDAAIPDRAFAACRALEPALVAALNAAPGHGPPLSAVPKETREDLRGTMSAMLASR